MEVQINEVVSRVRSVDGESLLSPEILHRILQAVMAAMEERDRHQQRVQTENHVTGGVWAETEGH